jgi:hypothetical protein
MPSIRNSIFRGCGQQGVLFRAFFCDRAEGESQNIKREKVRLLTTTTNKAFRG